MLEIRPTEPSDRGALLDLIRRTCDQRRTERDLAWAHEENPGGQRSWVAAEDGRLLACFATRPHRVVADGEERLFGELLDAAVSPEAGDGRWLLEETARTMLAETTGTDRDLVTYGCVEDGAWSVARQALKFEVMRMPTLLAGELDGIDRMPQTHEVGPYRPNGDEIRHLYDRARTAWDASCVRDEAYLRWRFVDHPRRSYEVLAARDASGELRGYAVLREPGTRGSDVALVADWLVPDDDERTGLDLLSGLARLGRALGVRRLAFGFPEWSVWFARLQELGFTAQPSGLRLATRKVHPRHETYWLRDAWWYQPADLALV